MTTLVIPAAAAGLGFFIGGPTGAAVGWALGSYATIEEPEQQIGDLRFNTSGFGGAIPMLAGKQRVAGNIIWAAEKTTYDIEQGGKGGGAVVGTGYKISLAIALCQGPILGVSRVWEQGEIKMDSSGKLPGKLYLGDNTQVPDPTIEAHEGAGEVPSYRGLAYIVLEDFDLGSSGQLPQLTFEVIKQEAF